MVKERALYVLRRLAVLLLIGLGYGLLIGLTGWSVPCPIHRLTGLYCPGCGISRFCLALLRLDFYAAFRSHMALFILGPAGLLVAGVSMVRYIRTGSRTLTRWQNGVLWTRIVVLFLFGVARNLPALHYLAPP